MRDRIARGESREEAEHAARREFGNEALVREVTRDMWGGAWLERLARDLRYTLRGLARSPGQTAAAVVTLGLGIGANAAVFSVADRVLIRPPAGVRAPDEIRRVYVRTRRTIGRVEAVESRFTYATFVALDSALAPRLWLAASTAPDSASGMTSMDRQPERLSYATANFFSTLGVRPALGRFFAPGEDAMGRGADVAVLSYGHWKRRFGGEPTAVGQELHMGDRRFTVIGVAPPGFTGIDLDAVDVWLPLSALRLPPVGDDPWYRPRNSATVLELVGRLPAGTPEEWLTARATVAYRRGWAAAGRADSTEVILAGPIQEALAPLSAGAEPGGPSTLAAISRRLLAVALLVALIACANVGNLLLARATARRRELATVRRRVCPAGDSWAACSSSRSCCRSWRGPQLSESGSGAGSRCGDSSRRPCTGRPRRWTGGWPASPSCWRSSWASPPACRPRSWRRAPTRADL